LKKCVFQSLFFFFDNPRYLGQFIRATTNHRAHWIPCKSNEQVRHHKDDMYVQRGSNPSAEKENKFFSLLAHDLKCPIFYFYSLVWKTSFFFFFFFMLSNLSIIWMLHFLLWKFAFLFLFHCICKFFFTNNLFLVWFRILDLFGFFLDLCLVVDILKRLKTIFF
jgi:hypothetical protein